MNVRAVTASLDAATGVQHRQRAPGSERARERRREDQDAGKGLGRRLHAQEAGPQFPEQAGATDARAHGDAEEPFDAAAAERATLGELARIEVELGLHPQQRRRVPGEPAANPEVAAVELLPGGRRDLNAGVEPRLTLRRSAARPRQHRRRAHDERCNDMSPTHGLCLLLVEDGAKPRAPLVKDRTARPPGSAGRRRAADGACHLRHRPRPRSAALT